MPSITIMAKAITNSRPIQARWFCVRMAASVVAMFTGLSGALADGSAFSSQLAFPGAQGFGAGAIGWRGGDVVAVTTLDDRGPGSLRACAENRGEARVCIFTVSGTISLATPIYLGANLYVAGQTAPGDGVQIRNAASTHTPLILKNVTDVVVRFLKIRPGPSKTPSPTVDAVTVENARRIYLGNLSMGFATDETFNIHVSNATAADITLADSLLALSLDRSTHPKGKHSKGALICSDEGSDNACGRITLLRNLFAHHRDRNPDIKATSIGPVEVINNVFYNPISQFGEFYDLLGETRIAYVGNVALTGPSTIWRTPEAVQVFNWNDATDVALMVRDNIASTANGCRKRNTRVLDREAKRSQIPDTDITLTTPALPSDQVLETVLARAGDQILPNRQPDALDARVLDDVRHCTGAVIDRVDQVGGWPDLGTAPAITDSDGDGFPDDWEAQTPGLDPAEPDDPWQPAHSGGTSNLELWLAQLAGDGT